MSSLHITRRKLIACGVASLITQPALAETRRLKLPTMFESASPLIKQRPTHTTQADVVEEKATQKPAAPAVSDSQRATRRGDRRLIVRPRLSRNEFGKPIDVVYYSEGKYFDDTNPTVNRALCDWRTGQICDIRRELLDFQWLLRVELRTDEPFFLLSGYRSPSTNAMLRRNSKGVAKNSLHMRGQAADLRLRSRGVEQISRAAQSLHKGGVGKYSKSNFTHIDCGTVRSWGA